MPHDLAISGAKFDAIGPVDAAGKLLPHCVNYTPLRNRLLLECRQGDKRPEDAGKDIGRVGADGWCDPLEFGVLHVTDGYWKPTLNCTAQKAGDWLVPIETHCRPLPGDLYEGFGPFKLAHGYSASGGAPRMELTVSRPVVDAFGRLTGITSEMVWTGPDIANNADTRITLHELFSETAGILRVYIKDSLVYELPPNTPYGYGPRLQYHCFRIYRKDQPYTAKGEFRSLSFVKVV